MDKETNLDAINKEFQSVKDELKEILLDIRVHLMEAQSPIPNDLEKAQLKEELKTQRG
jgi:NTP pyrophosphatase (non-canonical NTP hydrolase)